MKKQLIWALTLVLLALFPYQSVRADYCIKSGTPTDNNNSGRYVSAITITDGNSKSKTISGLQTRTGNVDNIYYDKTSEVFETTAGTTLTFSVTTNWDGAWQGAYVYIDYDCDKTFDTNLNATGTGTGELLINLSGQSGSFLSSISSSIITLPANLAPGDYRLRFKSDYNNSDPCGGNSTLVMVDVTLRIPGDSRTLTVLSNSSEAGTVTGGGTIKGGTIITATPNSGYEFVNWTDENGNEVSTSRSFDNFYVGDKTYKANFIKPITRSSITASSEETSGEGANGRANCIIDGSTSTFWHTEYTGGNATPPHWFMIDLGSVQTFDAFNYVSRGAKLFGNGAINEYRLYVSNSPIDVNNLPEAVAEGAFEYQTTNTSSETPEHHNIKLANTVSGRYVMLYAVSTWGSASNDTFANCAEFYLYQTSFDVTISAQAGDGGSVQINGENVSPVTVSLGSSVTLTATPDEGYAFVNWTNSAGTAVSTDATYTFNATKTDTYTANFVKECTVSVTIPDATQGTITINGEGATASHTITEGTSVELQATPKAGYKFEKWVINGSEQTANPYTTTVTSDMTVEAVFAQLKQFTFNVTQPEGATITVTNSEGQTITNALEGETITVEINPDYNYKDIQWFINGAVQAFNVITLTDDMPETLNITATLTKMTADEVYVALCKPSFNSVGNTSFVSAAYIANGYGVEDGTIELGELAVKGQQGATTKILANAGAIFDLNLTYAINWGDVEIFNIYEGTSSCVYGTYEGSWPSGNPLTDMSGKGIIVNGSTATFPIEIPQTLQVGDIFVVRSLVGSDGKNACATGINEGGYIDFLFEIVEPVAPSVAVKASPAEGGSVTINGGTDPIEIGEGVDVTVTAKPNPGYVFTGWTVRGEQISTDLTYTERVTTQKVFVANFVKPYTITASEAIKLYYQQYVGRGYQNQTLSRVKVTTTAENNARFGNATVSLAGTSNLSDISKVKLYLTNDTTFNAPSNPVYDSSKQEALLLGETSDITSEEVTFVIGENAMYNGVNYLWVVCDVASNASEDNVIKAQLKSIDGTDIAQLASDNGRMIMLGFNVLYDLNYDGSKYYRIPAIITASDGSLVALTDKRGATLTDLPNVISIVSRRSTDGGKTWSTPVYVAKGGETSQGSGRVDAYGDVAVMLDKESGNLISVFVGYQNRDNSSEGGSDGRVGLAASNQNNLLRLYKSVSTDNGQSWGTPVDISETVYSQIYTGANGKLGTTRYGLFAGSGHALTMEDGRLMFVVAARSTSNILPLHNFSVYSDDHGQTWTVSTNAATPDSNNSGNEAKVVELGNGNVLMSIRNGGARKFALSTDRGQSWNAATTSTLADPGCNGDIISYKYKGKTYLIQSICGSSSTRENVTIYLSTDNGATWPVRRQLVSGRSEYSSLTVLNDGSIAAFVEVGKHVDANDIGMRQTFFNFSLDWLLQGYDLDNTVLEFDGTRYMTIPDHDDFDIASNESFTVSAKFRYNALTENSNQRIIAKRNYGVLTQPGYELWGGNSTTQILAVNSPNASNNHNNSLSVWSTKTGVAGEWYHVALVIDRTNNVMTLYHNGEAVGSSSGKDLSQWSCVTDYDVYVGALLNGSNVDYKMNGAVDDLRFYGRALSASDVATDMNSSMPLENALAAYDFEMMLGYSVPDITGNGHTGTLVGFPEQILERTVSVQVRPSDAAESVTINGLDKTTLTASGDITINVEPKDGYRFVKWTDVLGNDVSTDKEYVDNSTQDTTYVANLVKLWKVTVTTNNRTWGIAEISGVDANGFVDNAADVTLTATSNNDARFMYWGLRTTENGEEVIKPVTTTNPFKTTILRNEDYVAVFEGDYPTMRLKYYNGSNIDHEGRVNRYLASVTATAGDLTTVVFEATNESGLPRIDAEVSAFYYYNGENLIPTTSGALIDKTGNAIMVKKGTETITLNFKAWLTNISLRNYSAKPELDETQQAIFVDWNNNKDFLDNGENLGIVSSSAENSFNAADGYNREISIPASAECGTYRMRVIYYDNLRSSDDWTSTIFEDCVINQGRAYDFEIDIVDDANYITFDAPGETYFSVGDKANIQMTYPNDEAVIYYTTDGFDPDENSPSITNGGAVAINTLQEGTITLKAIAKVGDVKSQVYKAVYTVVSKSSNLGAPTIRSDADATTIVAAEISLGVGIADGPIDYKFTQGQQVKLNAIPTTATATFSLDVTLDLNKYGLLIYRLDALKNTTQKSIKLAASYTADEIVSLSSFKNTLESKGFLYDTIPGAEDKIKIKIPVAMGEFADLSNGESVIYRLIVTNKETENVTLFPDQDYGIGEYVDFVFTVSPQTTKTKVAGGAGKQLSFTITTDDACYLSIGGYAQNLDVAGTTTIQAPLNVVGEMEIQSVGANISNMDIEILEYGTNVVLPNVDYLGTVTVKSDADLNATTISYASQLPADGIHLVVEKEIYVPYAINGKTPTYFNFLSLPFEFDCGLNIEYWDGDSWETAVLEKDIRILKYNSRTRSQGKDYYDYTWNTIGGMGGMIYANEGFVLVGNKNYGDADHKMKIRFKSFYPTDNTNVKRELKYFQDGGIKTVGVLPYRNNQGETHVCDADWNHIGSPYLTYTDAIDYVVYYHNGYSYQSVSPSENRQLRPFESFMFQANMEQLNQKDIAFFPLTANKQNAALNVYGRAYLAINGEESVKVILNDEASENFVVNEDGWYMAPTTNVFSTMSLKVAGSEASMSVQPEPNELPLTVYVGANAQQTISLSRFDGENNIFLKDAITEEVVCLNDEDYTFTATPYSTISDRFTITMIEPTGIGDQAKADGNIKAVVTTDGIKLFGTVEGDEVTLYTANGMVIANAIAEDGVTTIPTSAEGVIIIKVADETVKVVK